MYKLDIPLDAREAAALQARRNREEQRQSRIFDARTRQIGVDTDALARQMEEKRLRDLAEKERNQAYDSDQVRQGQIRALLEDRHQAEVRGINEKIDKFRLEEQQAETRREFDLSDPKSKLKDRPARVSDDDPRCQISSMQMFQGEDLSSKDRKKQQQEQMREWIRQQEEEKKRERDAENYANALHAKKMVEHGMRALQLASEEDECRKNINLSTKDFNRALADEKRARENVNKQKELDDNFTELTNQIYGDTLSENPSVAFSSFGSHRVLADRWKGMTGEQLSEIQETVAKQIEEKQREKDIQNQIKEEEERMQRLQAHALMLQEREQERKRQEMRRKLAEENLKLAEEHRLRQRYLDNEVYVNAPNDDYFAQFNTSSR